MNEAASLAQVGVEVGKAGTDGASVDVAVAVIEGVGGLEAVAGDDGDGELVGRDAAVGVEARCDEGGDAAGGLGEDALGVGELLDAGDDLGVGDVLAQPPVSRIIWAAAGPSAGLPMASERAMVLGRWGTMSSVPS